MDALPSRRLRFAPSGRARWVVVTIAAIVVLLVAGVVIRDELRARAAREAARRSLADGRLAKAEEALGRWLGVRPRAAEAHFLKARVALGQERPQEAVVELVTARALGYPAAPIDRLEAILRARAGQHAEAVPILRRILEGSEAPDPEVAEALARVYLETYRFRAAADAIDRWIRDAPDDATPYLWRTEVRERLDPDREAQIDDYRAALERDPGLDRAQLGLADALRLTGRTEEAAAAYASYLARRPDDPAGHLGAGLVAEDRGDEESAALHLDRTLALDPANAPALSARASIAMRRGEQDAALALLDRAVRHAPHDLEVRYRRGLCLARLGRLDEALAEQQVAARLKEDDRRLAEIQQQLIQNPGDPALQVEIARWLIEHGHEEEGIRWARKVLGERPDDREANRLMARIHERAGDHGLANYFRLQAEASPPSK
ncbi:tetratricopeptide repeat protein [Tautonia plasticadhaerens]|uniref:Tetratricopeptide repeat protein n=1 Tax=Tautonia plasticadhaerens TaxID=2527974 RepID=A0A518HA82_9BACT|nr:tetratricopeptide repeat protein [Tautonia plasticadhaerens]QDV37762.1 tetratricopeptide repeat protein [Tautonia plasticadhaerens]